MSSDLIHKPLNLLIIQPDPLCSMERFREWMNVENHNTVIIEPFLGDPVPKTLDGFDAVIVLGGEMGDGDDDKHPWLKDIRALLKSSTKNNQPTLGVCLGAQLLASANGGRVERGAEGLEAGVVEVAKTESSETDPLFVGLPDTFLSGAMHQDAIVNLPEDATHLATGTVYPNQAFRLNSSWGVQFHPELSPELFWRWLTETGPHDEQTVAIMEKGHEEFVAQDVHVYAANEILAKNFVKFVEQHRSQTQD